MSDQLDGNQNDPAVGRAIDVTAGASMYSHTVTSTAASASRLDKLSSLLKAEPDNLHLHRECVEIALREGHYERALDLVDARLSRHALEAESLYARSNALIGLKRYSDALELLKALEVQGIAPPAV